MKALTKEECKLIEDNHDLIYWNLNKNNLSINDYYDIAAIGLCKASINYNPNAGKFSTFAYKCMNNEVYRYILYDVNGKTKVPAKELLSYDISLNDDGSEVIVDRMIDKNNDIEECIITNIDYLSFVSLLNKKEQLIIKSLYNGLKQYGIAKKLGQSQQNVSLIIKKIKEKWNKYYNN